MSHRSLDPVQPMRFWSNLFGGWTAANPRHDWSGPTCPTCPTFFHSHVARARVCARISYFTLDRLDTLDPASNGAGLSASNLVQGWTEIDEVGQGAQS